MMTIADLRAELGLSQEAFAGRLGLKSKAHMSVMENSNRCSVRVALQIEELSGGRIPAAGLNPDIGLVEAARAAPVPAQSEAA